MARKPDSTPAAGSTSKLVTLKPRRRWLRRIGLLFVTLLLLLVGGHWYWGHWAEQRLAERVGQLRAAGEPVAPADLAGPAVPDAENAALDLRAAAAAIDQKSETWEQFTAWTPALPLTDDEAAMLKRVVGDGQDAMAKARTAAGKSGVDWQLQFQSPVIVSLDLKDLNQQRAVAQLLGAVALYAHHRGDDAEAVRRVREMLFVSRAIDRQPTLISHLVAIGLAAMAADRIELIAPDLRVGTGDRAARPDEVKVLLAELLDAAGPIDGQRRAFRGERVSEIDAARALVDGTIGLNAGMSPPPGDKDRRAQRAGGYLFKPVFLSDARLMADYMTGAVEAAGAADFPTFESRLPPSPEREISGNRQLHLLAAIMLPAVGRSAQQNYRGIAGRRMAAVVLAARWYALDHDGRLPDRLDDLAPAYLPAVPADPMTTGRPLAYVAGDRAVVYSVGEDGRDDGGRELPPGVSSRHGQEPQDVVVHLTRQPRPKPDDTDKKPQPWE